jgi:hypothetical protein
MWQKRERRRVPANRVFPLSKRFFTSDEPLQPCSWASQGKGDGYPEQGTVAVKETTNNVQERRSERNQENRKE